MRPLFDKIVTSVKFQVEIRHNEKRRIKMIEDFVLDEI